MSYLSFLFFVCQKILEKQWFTTVLLFSLDAHYFVVVVPVKLLIDHKSYLLGPRRVLWTRFVDRPRIAHILKHLVSTSFWLQNVMSSLLLPSIIVLQIDWQTLSCRFCVVASPLLARGESECEGACLPAWCIFCGFEEEIIRCTF